MVEIKNVRIGQLLTILLKLNLSYKLVNLILDEEDNTIVVEPVAEAKELKPPDDSKISEDNINAY